MKTAEQICRKHADRSRFLYRWLKRQTSKKWRRAGKLRPEDAPVRRPVRGWCD
jgi:hypothetical protein